MARSGVAAVAAMLVAACADAFVALDMRKLRKAWALEPTTIYAERAIPALLGEEEYVEELVVWPEDEEESENLSANDVPPWVSERPSNYVNLLTEREAQVVWLRYLQQSGRRTVLEVACDMGVSTARASQLEAQAKRKLMSVPPRREKAHWKIYGKGRRKVVVTKSVSGELGGTSELLISRTAAEAKLAMRLLESSVGYFYLKDDLGIDDVRLASIASRHGAVLSQRRDTLQRKGRALSQDVLGGLPSRDVVAQQPGILGFATQTLAAKACFVAEAYGLSRAEVGACCLEAPSLLTASLDRLRTCRDRLVEAGVSDLGALVKACPRIASAYRAPANARLLLSVMSERALVRCARCLLLRPTQVQERINAAAQLRIDLNKWPKLLGYDIEAKAAVLSAVLKHVDINKIIAKHPPLLGLSVENLVAKLHFFTTFFCDDHAKVVRLVERRPSALGLSLDGNLTPLFNSLKSQLSLSDKDLAALVDKYPTILGLSFRANILPKLELLQLYADDSRKVVSAVLHCPALLGYSLKGRLKPRLERMRQLDIPFDAITTHATLTENAFQHKLLAWQNKSHRVLGVIPSRHCLPCHQKCVSYANQSA